jgi:TrmH family RNA methyltransferase
MASAEPIRSRQNPRFKRLRALLEGADRTHCVLEGPKLIEEALDAALPIREVVASARAELRHRPLVTRLRLEGAGVTLFDEDLVASLSESEASQGLLAVAERPAGSDAWLDAPRPLFLVAVEVQNPGNLGALLRTAEAAGATGAFLTRGCADPFSWKALRGSMGSAFRLPLAIGVALDDVVAGLKARSVRIAAASLDGSRRYDEHDWREPTALFVGSEGGGLPPAADAAADARLAIPMAGRVESLNVAAATAVLLFEAARQRREAS